MELVEACSAVYSQPLTTLVLLNIMTTYQSVPCYFQLLPLSSALQLSAKLVLYSDASIVGRELDSNAES